MKHLYIIDNGFDLHHGYDSNDTILRHINVIT